MGTIWKKKKQNEAEREKKRKDERKVLTLTGLLMEGLRHVVRDLRHLSERSLHRRAYSSVERASCVPPPAYAAVSHRLAIVNSVVDGCVKAL
jgi:hypothetical protein